MPTYTPFQYETIYRFEGGGMGKGPAFRYGVTTPKKPTVTLSPAAPANTVTNQAFTIQVRGQGNVIDRLIVFVSFETLGVEEVIFRGNKFTPAYNGQSTIAEVTDGYDLTVRRNTGWPDSPKLFVHANTDKGGINAA